MPDISEYITVGSGTLKAADFGDDAEVVIEGHRMKHWEDNPYPTQYLRFVGYEKEWRCGIKNLRRIAEMYGKNTDNWIGKPLTLFKDRTNNPKTGEEMDTMIVRVRKTARNAPNDERNPPDDLNPPRRDPNDEIPF